MTAEPHLEAPELSPLPDLGPPRRGRRWLVAGSVIALLAVAAGVVVAADPFRRGHRSSGDAIDNGVRTSLATVTRTSLSSQTQVTGTLGYIGSYDVVNQVPGLVTALPSVGQVVRDGQILYEVSEAPVVLLYGSIPAYRSLADGMSGADVRELNADLVALHYATTSELSATSDYFSWWTKEALEKLQAHLGETQTGRLTLGQVVFLPSAARITSVRATLGAPAAPGAPVLQASSTTRRVTVALDAAQQSQVRVGDRVTITLPDSQTTPGRVTSIGTVATTAPSTGGGSGSSPTVAVDITPLDPAATGRLDQAPVQVSITTASVRSALVVSVTALLALASGGYAVETVGSHGAHQLVPVTLGLFDNAAGLVQVSGSELAAGQHVVVPSP
jgi:hypothetical protein